MGEEELGQEEEAVNGVYRGGFPSTILGHSRKRGLVLVIKASLNYLLRKALFCIPDKYSNIG